MSSLTDLDPSTPVIVGVGQVSERLGEPEYRARSEADLAADSVRAAFDDTGCARDEVASAIDTLGAIRSFEVSSPLSSSQLGRPANMPGAIARRVGVDARRLIAEVVGGQSPQHLLTELAGAIAAGETEAAVIVGAEVISTVRAITSDPEATRPDWNEPDDAAADARLEDRGFGLRGITTVAEVRHGLMVPVLQYSVIENARRARLGTDRATYTRSMAELFAPMTTVAAKNPHAASPVERTAEEIASVDDSNRQVTDPFPRLMIARDQVNQAAAVVLMSVSRARELGIPSDRWVFLHGHADLREKRLLDRPDIGSAPAAAASVSSALEVAGIGLDDVAAMDLYSCFPVAVSAVCDGLGLAPDDPRGLTVTGGLPYFGGPGNNYSMHAIVEVVDRVRAEPGSYGLVGANGGVLSKYSTGIYSTTPAPWAASHSARVQARLDAVADVAIVDRADGPAVIETFTVSYGKRGPTSAIVIGRLLGADGGQGARFISTVHRSDEAMMAHLTDTDQPIGTPVVARSFADGNRASLDVATMDALNPVRAAGFRDDYSGVLVRRDGHLLEVTINRPQARNALDAATNAELDEIFDAYLADPDLWVAILTGAGDKAFSSGNDLAATASGAMFSVPKNGFAGLTSRPDLTKPVIAAVNGHALGGGFEIALACHMIVADERATFSLPEVKVGLAALAGGLVRLPRLLGRSIAMEMILTGRRMPAAEALERGVVCRVAPEGTVMDAARELASEVLASSPTSVRASLIGITETQGISDPVVAAAHPTTAMDELIISQDTIEGVTAFVEKRAPVWRGR
ncbi:acetyl-CoA acetyltransferase [Williamsia herbipolensis]|uniref:acetyl-CoA acetyltransferase n=1 Tax=Williamsia herbipolensis TaxID=1603258 RepID=UPI0005F7A46B|nr:acetyl-CoA acetyltransferase [Williamsia herbipolensis]